VSRFRPERERITRAGPDRFDLHLPGPERGLLSGLPAQLRDLLRSDDPALERLFPPAHPTDPELNAQYRELVHEGLVAQRMSSVEVMERTLAARHLSEDEVLAWLSAVNDLRLVIGTRLDVTEDMEPDAIPEGDPRFPAWALYHYLTFLEGQIVDALSEGLATGTP
jgi:Domain of unknown function (DUF2017)